MLNAFFNVRLTVMFIILIVRINSCLASFNDNDKKGISEMMLKIIRLWC